MGTMSAMLRMLLLGLAATGLMAFAEPVPQPTESFQSKALGEVHVYRPAGPADRVAVVLSGDGGWKPQEASGRTAAALAARGVVALGLDVNQVFAVMAAPGGKPFDLAGALDALAREGAERYGARGRTILSGYSAGATLAYAAFAQAPAGRFSGLVTQGFCPDQDTVNPAGDAAGATIGYQKPKVVGWIYHAKPLPGPWAAIEGEREHGCPGGSVPKFVGRVPGAKLWTLPGMTHAFEPAEGWAAQLSEALTFTGVATAR